MPVHYEIDTTQGFVALRSERLGTHEQLRDVFDAVFADPRFRTGYHFYSELEEQFEVPSADYVKLNMGMLAAHAEKLGNCRFAVVSKTTAMFGMVRMAEFLAERTSIRLRGFHDREAALQWLETGEEPG